jgi:hypothetical protein
MHDVCDGAQLTLIQRKSKKYRNHVGPQLEHPSEEVRSRRSGRPGDRTVVLTNIAPSVHSVAEHDCRTHRQSPANAIRRRLRIAHHYAAAHLSVPHEFKYSAPAERRNPPATLPSSSHQAVADAMHHAPRSATRICRCLVHKSAYCTALRTDCHRPATQRPTLPIDAATAAHKAARRAFRIARS